MVKDEEVKKEEKEEVKKEGKEWVVGEVATQTGPVVTNGEEQLDVYAALARIMNDLDRLKRLVG